MQKPIHETGTHTKGSLDIASLSHNKGLNIENLLFENGLYADRFEGYYE